MKHIIFSIVCFAFVLFVGGHNEPGEKYLSLDLLKNEIDDLRRQMEDENDKVQSQVRELKNENDELKSEIKVLKTKKHELEVKAIETTLEKYEKN